MISAKNTFFFLNLLLLAGIVYFGVEIFYTALESKMEYPRVAGITEKPTLATRAKSTSPYAHYSPIMKRDLFKTGKVVAPQKDTIDVEALKLTELNLKLWGTVADEGGSSAFAVIEEVKTRKQSLYRTGDSIQNATVKAILREKVILSVNGKDEILEMAAASSEKAPAGQTRTSTRASTRTRAPAQRDITLQRAFVNDAVQDIGKLLGQVRIRPHFEKGKPAGLRMTGIRPNSIFSKMGLRGGDVLTGVEGQQIQSVNDVIGLYEKMKSSAKVDLEVKRRNRRHTITYRIQ